MANRFRIPGEPTEQDIAQGYETYRREHCDFLIGFGGGSPLASGSPANARKIVEKDDILTIYRRLWESSGPRRRS